LFGLAGLLRGGSREFLGTVSVFLAVFVINLSEKYAPYVAQIAADPHQAKTLFWIRVFIFVTIVFFGYQTPRWGTFGNRNMGGLKDALVGALLGALNGYLIVGMLWHYMDVANYPWPTFIAPPSPHDALSNRILQYLPSMFLHAPILYIAVAIFFVLVIVIIL